VKDPINGPSPDSIPRRRLAPGKEDHATPRFASVALIAVAGLVMRHAEGPSHGHAEHGNGHPDPDPAKEDPIVIGAEQWPECLNPITSCSSAT